ncbi:MAG TPA: class I SAM-dependent methyltransferase [Ktedonobacteraceae bacterium]|nr:class I SAM-dependent methyltransferase [Ktedonobacteraceae bacterium]
MGSNLSHPHAQPQRVRVPIQERACTVGTITAINGYRANRTLLKKRFCEGGYDMYETTHFLLFTRTKPPTPMLVHWFTPQELDANIGDTFVEELKPSGLLKTAQTFGDIFGAVVCSFFPHDPQRALHLYALNTLERYHDLLDAETDIEPCDSTINAFARLYKRVFEWQAGETFLDAGCSFGFLPLLIAEHFQTLSQVTGIDIFTEPFPVVRGIAAKQKLKHVNFIQADLLAATFSTLGRFDTVTALHILEHFTEADMYRVLIHLLEVTAKRLILAVPYEPGEAEIVYGHEQVFTRSKLEAVGEWCMKQMGGHGRMHYEDCAGGLLLIERM